MDEMCGFNSADKPSCCWENLIFPSHDDYSSTPLLYSDRIPTFGSDDLLSAAAPPITSTATTSHHEIQIQLPAEEEDDDDVSVSTFIKAKIASHPSYPRLLEAYIDCQKVGAPPEIASLLDEIRREKDLYEGDIVTTCLGADPELDEFMETYCDMLVKYKSDLARPFDEATTFLNKVEMQLRNLCTTASVRTLSADDGGASTEEEYSGGENEGEAKVEDRDLKDKLLRKFGSHIGSLKLEFSKKKKKGKLPKESRQALLHWWNAHYKWPYPTESDKLQLAEATGLDQKQINNWFINQRKRHWKPSENMHFAVMDKLSEPLFTDD